MRKVGAVSIVVMGLLAISMAFNRINVQYFMTSSVSIILLSLLPSASLILLGTILIRFRDRLAKRWFSDSLFDALVDGVHLVRLILIFFGLLLSTFAISAMITTSVAATHDAISRPDPLYSGVEVPGFWGRYFPALAGDLFQFAVGLFMVMASAPLSLRIWSLKRVETREDKEDMSACSVCNEPFNPADYRPDAIEPKCTRCGSPLDVRQP